MCGNGIRCFARFVADEGISSTAELEVETLAGIVRTRLLDHGLVEVDMGEPRLSSEDVSVPENDASSADGSIQVEERGRLFTFVSMGNPHAVAFVDKFDFDWRSEGASVEMSASFPNRTNVHFARLSGPDEVEVKVWERGCGETMACGTGACAVAVAGAVEGLLPRTPVTIHLPGGSLAIHWNDSGRVVMTGSATYICKGVYWF